MTNEDDMQMLTTTTTKEGEGGNETSSQGRARKQRLEREYIVLLVRLEAPLPYSVRSTV